jgi:hypothetical protein
MAGFPYPQPNEIGPDKRFHCRYNCGKSFTPGKKLPTPGYNSGRINLYKHEKEKCKNNPAAVALNLSKTCRFNCGVSPEGFYSEAKRNQHEARACWKNLTKDTNQNTVSKAEIIHSALRQVRFTGSILPIDFNIGTVGDPLKTGLTYPEWIAVYVLQEPYKSVGLTFNIGDDIVMTPGDWYYPQPRQVPRWLEPNEDTPTKDFGNSEWIDGLASFSNSPGLIVFESEDSKLTPLESVICRPVNSKSRDV